MHVHSRKEPFYNFPLKILYFQHLSAQMTALFSPKIQGYAYSLCFHYETKCPEYEGAGLDT